MKKLLLVLGLFLMGCSSDPITVENPEKVTTTEIINLSKSDSTSYKVVELDNTVYILKKI